MNSLYAKTLSILIIVLTLLSVTAHPTSAECPEADPQTGIVTVSESCNTGTIRYYDYGTIGQPNLSKIQMSGAEINLVIGSTLTVGSIDKIPCSECFITLLTEKYIVFKQRPYFVDADGDGYPDASPTIAASPPAGVTPGIGFSYPSIIDADTNTACADGTNPGITCKKCVNGGVANQDSSEDLFNQCIASYNSCSANKCVRLGGNGFCSGSGACDTSAGSLNVVDGKVCSTGSEITPNITTNAGIGYSCPSTHCNGFIYYRACDGSGNPRADNIGAGSSAVNVGTSKYISSTCVATNGNCTTGTNCGTYYRDADNDAYGDSATSAKSCVSAPSGWVADNTDANPSVSCADGVNPAGVCNKCLTGAVAYQSTSEDLFNECAVSYTGCYANKCTRTGPSGNCDNAGACNTTGGTLRVVVNKVCSAGSEFTPSVSLNTGTSKACTANSCGGTIYYQGCNGTGGTQTVSISSGSSAVSVGTSKIVSALCVVSNGNCTTNGTGTCSTIWRDADSDSYGTNATTSKSCSTAPSGWVAGSGTTDCCDGNANVKPGQTTLFASGRTGCTGVGSSWDYDCNGSITYGIDSGTVAPYNGKTSGTYQYYSPSTTCGNYWRAGDCAVWAASDCGQLRYHCTDRNCSAAGPYTSRNPLGQAPSSNCTSGTYYPNACGTSSRPTIHCR